MLSPAERAGADLEAHRGTVAGRLTLAAFATAARGLGPGALRALRRDHPLLRVTVEEAEPHGAEPEIAHTAAGHHTRLALVAAGLGVAIIPGSAAPRFPAESASPRGARP